MEVHVHPPANDQTTHAMCQSHVEHADPQQIDRPISRTVRFAIVLLKLTDQGITAGHAHSYDKAVRHALTVVPPSPPSQQCVPNSVPTDTASAKQQTSPTIFNTATHLPPFLAHTLVSSARTVTGEPFTIFCTSRVYATTAPSHPSMVTWVHVEWGEMGHVRI